MDLQDRVHVGTSGWHYDHWKGPFYPNSMARADFLSYYSARFHTVEINHSFYRLPSADTLSGWREAVSGGFIFCVKAGRYITHMKKLKDPRNTLHPFLSRIELLKPRLGPVLLQLPPHWSLNRDRLATFVEALPEGFRFAFEFRDGSWFHPSVYEILKTRSLSFCIYELDGRMAPDVVTADFVYIRLHGPGTAYQGEYGDSGLEVWTRKILDWAGAGKEIFCYFDNDQAGYAARDALRLTRMLRETIYGRHQ